MTDTLIPIGQVKRDISTLVNRVAQTDALVAEVLARRDGATISVDDLVRQEREELEERSGWIAGSH